MAISTLYDYYTSKGQALPSLSTRSGLYSQYGLTGNYTGTAQQNTALLQKLMSGSTTTPTTTTVAPTPTTTFSTTPVAADTLSAPTTQIRLPASNFDTGGAADSTVAGATTTQKSLQDYINQLTAAKTPEQTQADALSSSISDLLGQNTGRSTALGVEEANRGVPGISKDLADINAQIATRTAAYDKQYESILNPTDPNKMAILPVAGSQADALRRQEASDIGFLQARALGLQGQLTAAQDAAKRAVDLRYGAIEEQINTKLKQLELLQPTLSKQDKILAAALEAKYNDEKQAIADQKAEANGIQQTMIEAIKSGITDSSVLAGIANAKSLDAAIQIWGANVPFGTPDTTADYKNWILAGGEAGTGMSFAQWQGKTTPGTPSSYQVQTGTQAIQTIDALIPQISSNTTGWGSFFLGKLPESQARYFAGQLDTLKSNIAFGALQAMRAASTTGGALGQVSDREGKLLESTLGSLDQMQSADQLRTQLNNIKASIQRWVTAVGASTTSNSSDFSW